jgi:hypothetical protein
MQALISAPVAQPDRAPGFEPGGRGFDPLRAYSPRRGVGPADAHWLNCNPPHFLLSAGNALLCLVSTAELWVMSPIVWVTAPKPPHIIPSHISSYACVLVSIRPFWCRFTDSCPSRTTSVSAAIAVEPDLSSTHVIGPPWAAVCLVESNLPGDDHRAIPTARLDYSHRRSIGSRLDWLSCGWLMAHRRDTRLHLPSAPPPSKNSAFMVRSSPTGDETESSPKDA